MDTLLIIITVIAGLITFINLFGSMVRASEGLEISLGLETALIFVLLMFFFIKWWTILVGIAIVFQSLMAVGIYEKNK